MRHSIDLKRRGSNKRSPLVTFLGAGRREVAETSAVVVLVVEPVVVTKAARQEG